MPEFKPNVPLEKVLKPESNNELVTEMIEEESGKLDANFQALKSEIDSYGGIENIKETITDLIDSEEEGKTSIKEGVGVGAVLSLATVLEVVAELDQSQSHFFEYLRENSIHGSAGFTAFVTGMLTLIPLLVIISSKIQNRKIRKQREEKELEFILKSGGYQGKKLG